MLDKFSPVLHLVQTMRDEAHRFAVTFHRTRRNASRLTSELEQVPGIGRAHDAEACCSEFGSSERVRAASETQIAKLIGPAAARKVTAFYSHNGSVFQIYPGLENKN